ncbi:hypothetical protein BJY19_000569 [Arthrobacter cupressi]|nr:GTPase RsgA [Arthrobacter cupressi]NYD76836.1 hypothetical protein [Arthrobacter cupressi]
MTFISGPAEGPATPDTTVLEGPHHYGFTPETAEYFRNHPPSGHDEVGDDEHPGRVVRLDRNRVLVAGPAGLQHLPYPSHGPAPVTGDWVWLGRNRAGEPAVVGILPRRTSLGRKRALASSTEEQVLGANIDVVGVVVPVDRPLSPNRLERTLVAAWDSGATPLVIITKADLADLADDVVGQVMLHAAGGGGGHHVRRIRRRTRRADAARSGGRHRGAAGPLRCREVQPHQRAGRP